MLKETEIRGIFLCLRCHSFAHALGVYSYPHGFYLKHEGLCGGMFTLKEIKFEGVRNYIEHLIYASLYEGDKINVQDEKE